MSGVDTILVPREVRTPAGAAWLYADLVLPPGFEGLVLFDLLTEQEEQTDLHTRAHRSDISLLTRRMQDATAWAAAQAALQHAAITAPSLLIAGARRDAPVRRGGRATGLLLVRQLPDLTAVHRMTAVNLPFRHRRHTGQVLALPWASRWPESCGRR